MQIEIRIKDLTMEEGREPAPNGKGLKERRDEAEAVKLEDARKNPGPDDGDKLG